MQYRVLSPTRYGDHTYSPGELIDLGQHEAKQLVEVGAVEPVHKPYEKDIKTPWGDVQ